MTKTSVRKGPGRRRITDLVVDIPDRFKTDDWIRDLRRRYEVYEEPSENVTAIFLDTFDGRLFEQGLACSSSGGIVRLDAIDGPIKRAAVAVEPPPRFAADFPEGALKDQLLPVIKHRALLKVLTTSTDRRSWRILNVDQKTVASFVLEETKASDDMRSVPVGPILILKKVRGYGEIAREMEEWLQEHGLNHPARSVYLQALDALDKTPRQDLTSLRPELIAAMPAPDAVRSLLALLYALVRVNEAGVLCDTDTEFLHDYRVAIRKARSLVGQTRGVFARGPTARLQKSLSWLGRSTNALRDLDVYLLHQWQYRNLLGSPSDEHIEPLFELLRRKRADAFQVFVRIMNSQEYADVLSSWGRMTEEPVLLGLGAKGTAPIEQVARRCIAKKCRAVLERGYEISPGTDSESLHALRIECKQLRYLMELFASLVAETRPVIRGLKRLQDNLGNIQDLTIQEERLRHYLTGSEIDDAGPNAAKATKELMILVLEERTLEQKRLLDLFARFNESLGKTHTPYTLLLPWLQRSM